MASIEQGIPLPKDRADWGTIRGTLRKMAPRDSVSMAEFDPQSVRSRITEVSRELGAKFTTRKTAEGLRVWRSR